MPLSPTRTGTDAAQDPFPLLGNDSDPDVSFNLALGDGELQGEAIPGSLHLVPCTLDAYLELPNKAEDRYELSEGVLFYRDTMADSNHTKVREYIASKLRVAKLSGSRRVNIYTETKVSVQSQGSSSSVRIPDIVIGPYVSSHSSSTSSPASKKMIFRAGKVPIMAIEITSPSNRAVDLCDKSIQYSKTGIPTYVIVDRAGRRVIVRTGAGQSRNHGGYQCERVFQGEQIVDCRLFRDQALTPNMVLDPPQTAEEVIQSPIKRAKLLATLEKETAKAARAVVAAEKGKTTVAVAAAKTAQAGATAARAETEVEKERTQEARAETEVEKERTEEAKREIASLQRQIEELKRRRT